MKSFRGSSNENNKSRRVGRRSRSVSDGITHMPPTASVSSFDERLPAVEEDSPELPPPSPRSPVGPLKKTWERQYRSFLTKQQNHPQIPVSPRKRNTQELLRSQNLPKELPTDSASERSVRGGNFFANIFRHSNDDKYHRRVLSQGDELDGTLRRGAEKAYSPGNTRYRKTVQSNPDLDGLATSMKHSNLEGMIPPASLRAQGDLQQAKQAMYIPRRFGSDRKTAPKDELDAKQSKSTKDTLDEKVSLRPRSAEGYAVQSALMKSEPVPLFLPRPPLATNEKQELDASSSSAMKKAFTEFHNSAATGRDAVSPFLGDDPSWSGGEALVWTKQQLSLQTPRPPTATLSYNNLAAAAGTQDACRSPGRNSETIDISRGMRILKPIVRRRLVAKRKTLLDCSSSLGRQSLAAARGTPTQSSRLGRGSCRQKIVLWRRLAGRLPFILPTRTIVDGQTVVCRNARVAPKLFAGIRIGRQTEPLHGAMRICSMPNAWRTLSFLMPSSCTFMAVLVPHLTNAFS